MAFYGLGLGTLFFVVGTFAVNLPKAGAWMMAIKWVGGVCLAYMALGYIRDAMPKETLHKLAHPGTPYVAVGAVILLVGLVLAGIHVAAERRRSPIAHLSKPTKLASILPAIAGLFMVVTWYQLPHSAAASAGQLQWESSEAAATAKAITEHRPLLVDFGASWCGACKELEEKTFPDPQVRAEGARFIALHVDATDDDDQEVAKVRQSTTRPRGCPSYCFSTARAARPCASPSSFRPIGSQQPFRRCSSFARRLPRHSRRSRGVRRLRPGDPRRRRSSSASRAKS